MTSSSPSLEEWRALYVDYLPMMAQIQQMVSEFFSGGDRLEVDE